MIIYGSHAVLAFLKHRPKLVKKVYLSSQTTLKLDIKNLPLEVVSLKELSNISKTNDHQGICAEIDHFPYSNLDYSKLSKICVLDHIEDPRNLGAIMRNALAFNVEAIIIPKDRACDITPAAVKASAGAAAIIPVCKVGNINQTINEIKRAGFWVYGFEADGKEMLSNITFDNKTAIVLGSEGKGMSKLTRNLCDFTVAVEMDSMASSLNVSACSAIIFYKLYVQKT